MKYAAISFLLIFIASGSQAGICTSSKSGQSNPRIHPHPPQKSPTQPDWSYLYYEASNTRAMSPVNIKIWNMQVSKYGIYKTFELNGLNDQDQYTLRGSNQAIDKEYVRRYPERIANGKYTYVVTVKNSQPHLILGRGPHYLVSGKRGMVLAAGEIAFDNGLILGINNQSGAYNISNNVNSYLSTGNYQKTFVFVMTTVFNISHNEFDSIYNPY